MPNRIQNQKNALVTGAARGIGRAIALSLAKEGYNVAVLYLGSEEAAEQTCDEIRQLGRQALCIHCDVACGESCRQAVAQVIEEFGSIDVLVNNAGIVRDSLVLSMKEEDFEQVVQTNLNGAFYMIKHTCRQFIKNRRGRIINISSVTGKCRSGKLCLGKSRIDRFDQIGRTGVGRQEHHLQCSGARVCCNRHDRSHAAEDTGIGSGTGPIRKDGDRGRDCADSRFSLQRRRRLYHRTGAVCRRRVEYVGGRR